jgi:hypothetical protein
MGEESSDIMGWSSTADVEIEAVGADAGGQVLAELVAEVETACILTNKLLYDCHTTGRIW